MKVFQRDSYLKEYFFFFIIIFINIAFKLQAQDIALNYWQVDSLIVIKQDHYRYHFPSRHFFDKQSVRITKNGIPLYEMQDYIFKSSKIILFTPDPSIGDSLRISYQRLPFNLKASYYLFKKDTLKLSAADSAGMDSGQVRLLPATIENPFEDFGSGLKKSGSIMRGVNIGTNQDLTLNSGLNLQLSGQLSENVEIVAALTDESTPIQPEGNTQTLDEVDRVFIRFKSPYVEGTVGDLNLEYKDTQFGNLSRKLQGITLLGKYANQFAGATVATTRGFFNRVSFIGQEGNQGPYQLTGKNGEKEIIVLAGTEKIWINGKRMLRGETNDYVIEYGNGQITFTNNQLVTSESRIEIDFEYFPAIQKYNRSALSGLAGGSLYGSKLNYKVSFYEEKDNADKVIGEEQSLTDEEKAILKAAGDDYKKASITGVKYVGSGKGNYVQKDTLYNNQHITIYQYAGLNSGDYDVVFTLVGQNQGDYVRDRLAEYRWVGTNLGNYAPIKLIPLPQTQQLTDVNLQWNPSKNIAVTSEYALSNYDKNSFSNLQKNDDLGDAVFMDAKADNLAPSFFGNKLGLISLNMTSRIINKNFESVDRFNDPDYQRYWNILQAGTINNQEKSIQFNSTYIPVQELKLRFNVGDLEKNDLQSQRLSTTANYDKTGWFKSDFNYELVNSKISDQGIENDWKRINGNIQKNIWWFTPQLLYDFENRKNQNKAGLSGFLFNDYGLRLSLFNWSYLTGYTQINERRDDVYDVQNNGRLVPQSSTNTKQFRVDLINVKETTASLKYVTRKKDFTARFENIKQDTLKLQFVDASVQDTVWQDRQTNLAELTASHSHWNNAVRANLQYKVSTEQTALREKDYIKVKDGRGNLRFDEDLKEYVPDPDGNYVLFILPSGKFEPVTKLESSLRLTYDPSRFWHKPKGPFQTLMNRISGNSYFRVEEETKEKDLAAIYFLNLSKFQKDLTLRGSLIYDQDLYIMKNNRDLNFRLQYRYRDDLFNQFLDPGENEDRLSIERSFRTDWKISRVIKSQSEIGNELTKRIRKSAPLRNRNIDGFSLNQKFFYKPLQQWEFQLSTEYGQEENKVSTSPLKLWYTVSKLQANYVVAGKGRISAEYEQQVVKATSNPLDVSIPFEMAGGKKEGVSKKWQLRAEYTVSKNILFTLLYRGRNDAGFNQVIHTGQAEVRAFF